MDKDQEQSRAPVSRPAERLLSKSDLLSFNQCPRRLWLEKHRPGLAAPQDSSHERRTMDGELVGEKARQVLGPKVIWPEGHPDKQVAMEVAIASMMAKPDHAAVELPMVREGLYARADAMVPVEGGYVLRETKASTFPLSSDKTSPGKAEPHHLDDAAIQTWVAQATGLPVIRTELNLLDSRWRYPGMDNYDGLFRQLPVDAEIETRLAQVPIWLAKAKDVVAGDMPAATTGAQCKKPHQCPFKEHCLSLEPAPEVHPIELLPDSAGKALAKKLKANKGYVSILEPAPEELVGAQSKLYQRIQLAHASGQSILEPGSRELMEALPYPRYYFDFEGIDLAVPRWEGVRPYEQIPFQWSCHIERSPGVFEHHEFLDVTGNDPSLACIEKMAAVIDPMDKGPILVFYQTYEKGRLEELAQRHPQHTELMQIYIGRLVDLHPMVKNHFYSPKMEGSFSIKKVLPVIAPDLAYDDLEGVQEGTAAQVAYLHACFEGGMTEEAVRKLVDNLLAYCDQDTWAMVEVGYFLEHKPRPFGLRPGARHRHAATARASVPSTSEAAGELEDVPY